jgi:alpha-mannosidase
MNMDAINVALDRLKKAADESFSAWPEMKFTKVNGAGPDELTLNKSGAFTGLVVEPGTDLVLKTKLEFNDSIAGISIHGDMLDVTVMSLYPFEMSIDGREIFKDTGVPVAAGPVFKMVVPHIRKGDNGELTFTLHIPDHQTTEWLYITFSTPKLRARQELLDTAWAELTFANALAETEEEFAMVEKAVAHVPEDMTKFNGRSMMLMELELYDMKKKVKDYQVHVIGHSHIDMNWLWTWPDTFNVILRDFKSVLDMMDDYPEMTFTHSQPATYDVIREHAPDLFKRVQERIKEGRWEPATITWVEGDTNMASGEAMVRQMLEAGVFTADQLNTTASTFLMPDTFGHAGNLPQLAVSAGAKRYYHHRANPGKENMYPAYWWEGQDGSRLLAISTPSYNGGIRARDLVNAALTGKKFNFNESVHFHGIGDHGGGPARHNMEALQRFQTAPLLPFAICSTLEIYANTLIESGVDIPEVKGESDFVFEGCYTTHGDIKQENRAGENLLSTADTLTALAGLDKREQLSQAWRTVCFNQFHDIFDGSGIHEVYADSTADFENVSAAAQQITDEALSVLHAGLEKGAIAVTNPLGWEQTSWVNLVDLSGDGAVLLTDSDGQQIIGQYGKDGLGFVATVPAYSTVSYKLGEAVEVDELIYSDAFAPTDSRNVTFLAEQSEVPPFYHIETPHFSVYLRKDSGILTSFVDKRENRELVAYGMRRAADYFDTARPDLALNVFQIEDEHPHPMSAWHLDEVHTTHSLLRGAETKVIESGPARIVFEVTHKVRSSTIIQQIIFYRDLARVDFIADVDWQEPGNDEVGVPNLKAAFTASLMECQAWFETPFAAVQRPANGQERPALRWVDMGGADYGVAVLNDSKHGYDVLGNRVRLTLVRSGYNPDKIADIGQHTIRYSFVPHVGDWRAADIVRQGIGFNQSLLANVVNETVAKKTDVWFPWVEGDGNIVPSIFKQARKGEGRVLRLYESTGANGSITISGVPEGLKVCEANILEQPQKELAITEGKVEVTFTPWQVKTLRIE